MKFQPRRVDVSIPPPSRRQQQQKITRRVSRLRKVNKKGALYLHLRAARKVWLVKKDEDEENRIVTEISRTI